MAAKAYWGYDAAFLDRCRVELTWTPEQVAGDGFQIAERGAIVGFYRLAGHGSDIELSDLFVDPAHIRTGIGALLWRHMCRAPRVAGVVRVHLAADPHAEAFYLAMGARRIGETPSTVLAGRSLPLMAIDLPADTELDTGGR